MGSCVDVYNTSVIRPTLFEADGETEKGADGASTREQRACEPKGRFECLGEGAFESLGKEVTDECVHR